MVWTKFQRRDQHLLIDLPKVIIRPQQFIFNSKFITDAGLTDAKRVAVLLDDEERKIGFKFEKNDDDQDGFVLHNDGGSPSAEKLRKSRAIKVITIISQNSWIQSVAQLKDNTDRQFTPKWDNISGLWIIKLMPAFELKASNISEIASTVKGIYRYLRSDGTVVYIGKGNIKTRYHSQERQVWDFDTVEYSIIENEAMQFKWEAFWLDKHVSQYEKLPFYNQIGGHKSSA